MYIYIYIYCMYINASQTGLGKVPHAFVHVCVSIDTINIHMVPYFSCC